MDFLRLDVLKLLVLIYVVNSLDVLVRVVVGWCLLLNLILNILCFMCLCWCEVIIWGFFLNGSFF